MKEATDPTDALNELGADGWELAETIEYVEGGTKLLILKRPAGTTEESGGTSGEDGPPSREIAPRTEDSTADERGAESNHG